MHAIARKTVFKMRHFSTMIPQPATKAAVECACVNGSVSRAHDLILRWRAATKMQALLLRRLLYHQAFQASLLHDGFTESSQPVSSQSDNVHRVPTELGVPDVYQ